MRRLGLVLLLLTVLVACNPTDPIDRLLSQMTLEEKCGQLTCPIGFTLYGKEGDSLWLADDFIGRMDTMPLGSCWAVLRADPWSQKTVETGLHPGESARMLNKMQRYAVENTRLGIPLLFCEETPHGHMAVGTTVFPTGIAQASTWDPELLERMGEVMGLEIRLQGAHVGYGPVLDIARDPRWSRVEETMGEDPYLSGVLGTAVVKGMQKHVVATLKHLAAYGVPQGGHNAANADVGPNRLKQDYLPAFERAVKEGQAGSVMTAYNSIDGVPCTANRWLLEEVLRQSWGFKGVVFADLNAINALYATHHVAADPAEAAAMALQAGVDIDLGGYNYGGFLKEALQRGLVTEADIDRAVRHVLQLKYDLGLFDNPYVDEALAEQGVGTPEHVALAKQVALESAVLLKNDGILPFDESIKKVAVLGPNSDHMYAQLGDYTAPQDPDRVVTMLEGIRGKGRVVVTDDLRAADAVVLVVGGSSARDFKTSYQDTGAAIVEEHASEMDCGEGYDRSTLRLLGDQEALMQQVYAFGKPVVTVYICGRPMEMTQSSEQSNALLLLWYPGMEGGAALADILWGDYNPSGKLPISIPRSVGQIPVYYSMPATGDYVEESAKPLYPFGFGLSYTQFDYSPLEVGDDEVVVVVTNVGDRDGDEVVQLYASAKTQALTLWSKRLVGFQRIHLQAGESQRVVFPVTDLSAIYSLRTD
ncbi:MAG: glycoside hydrolase family 3 C-terminal domain-containing protein [Bacteroidales bacterium]|nr:glycoside hydrolase family 3 C-terminal domain-containing protein [Bacteroidales bacterium]